jgi:hypothetical protein
MPPTFKPQKSSQAVEFQQFFKPIQDAMIDMPKLESQGNRPLQMTFEDHLKALVYFHLEEHHSAQHLLQVLEQDDFARNQIAPEDGIKKSSFSEATNSRGLEQFFAVPDSKPIDKHRQTDGDNESRRCCLRSDGADRQANEENSSGAQRKTRDADLANGIAEADDEE